MSGRLSWYVTTVKVGDSLDGFLTSLRRIKPHDVILSDASLPGGLSIKIMISRQIPLTKPVLETYGMHSIPSSSVKVITNFIPVNLNYTPVNSNTEVNYHENND